ncbi:putative ABC transporter permease protein [Nocardia asteroides NBRC 15531]|uniref:ABC transporter permease protein n=2 Tax=Nocardia asteroides TaxID=1824 RepID=U5EDU3_NOCAS|nr:putative ABC transporter permease protein [Nocardia asteroides NBRC 15531]SFL67423.1 carbohydrate ABC transporter membrane protein 2, CUT1 family [Nocardia asteroides]VEG31729.1 Inner membrane ABC transporter permease protein ycjP [Nocardia asteroides]
MSISMTKEAPAQRPEAPVQPVSLRKRLGTARMYLGVLIVLVWGLGPFYWMTVVAFRDQAYTFDSTPWPTHVTLDNFRNAFDTSRGNNFGQALLNSVIIGSATTAIALALGVLAAYALARMAFAGKYLVSGLILSASMFPAVVLVTPLFQLFTDLGWIGEYQAMIIPNISFVLPMTVYILASFFAELPWELEEAARIDGATKFQAFRLIMLPLAAPAVFTTAILAFIASINEYLLARLLSGEKTRPVTVAIAQFSGNDPLVQPYAAIMAAGVIVTVPLVIMVLVFQRRIISGLTAGGVKS